MKPKNFSATFPIACHTDKVGPHSTFFALKGQRYDGAHFIPLALEKGATAVIASNDCHVPEKTIELCAAQGIPLKFSSEALKDLASLSAQACENPAEKLRIIGITGTKGKTTSCFMLEHCLQQAGYTTALLSTVYNKIGNDIFPTNLTTQHADYLQVFLKTCVESKIDFVIMEVSAQAVTLFRVHGIQFEIIIFTNFSNEHGEFYNSEAEYFSAKSRLLFQLKSEGSLISNADNLQLDHPTNITFGMFKKGSYQGICTTSDLQGSSFTLITNHPEHYTFFTPLVGIFNIYNCLSIIAACRHFNLSFSVIKKGIATFKNAPGRLEPHMLPNGARCYIDYAHTADSFEAVLSTLKTYTPKLIAVFGAGGDRDTKRRPLMGAIAARYATFIIVTTDNPRSEDPSAIAQEIISGISSENQEKIMIELDRQKAIELAYSLSDSSTIIVLLGKGPDEYQIVQGVKTPFSERAIIEKFTQQID